MKAIDAILTRRSIRSYTDQPIEPETVETLLRAAMAAPSAGNEQPWEFIVISDRGVLDALPTAHPHAQMAAEAPLAVVVCGDTAREKYAGFWVQDCSAAVQNLLLAAHASGLGAVWCGLHPSVPQVDAIRELLVIPKGIIPLALLVIGYPSGSLPPSDRFDPARVHRNRWPE